MSTTTPKDPVAEFKSLPAKNRTYVLTGEHTPISFMINARHTKANPLLWFDPIKKINRALRYAKNQKSVFEDEQDGNFILEHITIIDGKLEVPKENPVLQLFLHLHPRMNIDFKELDFEKLALDEAKQMDIEDNARDAARNIASDTAIAILRIYTTSDVDNMSIAEIRSDIRVYARRHPAAFLDAINDPTLKMASFANKLLSSGMIVAKNNNKDLFYNLQTNKKKLFTIPFGETPVDALTKYLVTEDGLEMYRLLEHKVDESDE